MKYIRVFWIGLSLAMLSTRAEVVTSMGVELVGSDMADGDPFASAVAADGDVVVVGARTVGKVYVFTRNQGGTNRWGEVKKLIPADPLDALDRYGVSVAAAGDTVAVSRDYADINGVTNQGAVHVFERRLGGSGWGEAARLLASDGTTNDFFGCDVAMSGDLLVVGAFGDDDGANSAGAAYVFERRDLGISNAWVEVKKLVASDPGAANRFGYAVAVDGDVVAIGAPRKDGGGGLSEAGAVYVFERNAGGTNAWGQVAKLTASDAATNRQFGSSVSMDGDVIAVGAPGDLATSPDNLGYAYAFVRTRDGTNAWQEAARMIPSEQVPGQGFAEELSVSGDLIAISAWSSNRVFIFQRDAGGDDAWGEVQRIAAPAGLHPFNHFGRVVDWSGGGLVVGVPNGGVAFLYPFVHQAWLRTGQRLPNSSGEDDNFGFSVDIDGAVQIVGAPYRDIDGTNNAGAAYIYERGTAGQIRRLVAPTNRPNIQFGYAVAVDGDVAVVGAPFSTVTTNFNAGLAHVFHRDQGGTNAWGFVCTIQPNIRRPSEFFGVSVDISGDTIIAGRVGYLNNQGIVDFFRRNDGGTGAWDHVFTDDAGDSGPGKQYGYSVAIDMDAAIVGSPGDSGSRGAAYVLQRMPGSYNTWIETAKLTNSMGATNDQFGISVDLSGDTAIVAAYEGQVVLFERDRGGTNAWGEAARLVPAGTNFNLVNSVALHGDVAVVGDFFASFDGIPNAGLVHVFERNAGGSNAWGQVARLQNQSPGASDLFGRAVAVDGQLILVGVPADDPGGVADAGRVQIYSGALHGPPAIASIEKSGANTTLSFPAQPAWRYSVEGSFDLLGGPWIPVPGQSDLPGPTDGGFELSHTNLFNGTIYRVVREPAP